MFKEERRERETKDGESTEKRGERGRENENK
jgi:hypothetical protein